MTDRTRVYWGCTTFGCAWGFESGRSRATREMPREWVTCPKCGGELTTITSSGPALMSTSYLDEQGITFKDNVPDHAVTIIDTLLRLVNSTIDWGEWDGRRRNPCPEQPVLLAGMPLGQYHCPVCMEMQVAGLPHLPPDENYEMMTGQAWPAGYQDGAGA